MEDEFLSQVTIVDKEGKPIVEETPVIDPSLTLPEGMSQIIIDDGSQKKPDAPVVTATPGTYTPSPFWENYTKKYNEQIPEVVKTGKFEEGKSEIDYIEEAIYNKKKQEIESKYSNIPDIAKQIIEQSKDGEFNEEEFFNKRNSIKEFMNLSNENFLTQYYGKKYGVKSEQNPNGIDPAVIKAKVDETLSSPTAEINVREMKDNIMAAYQKEQSQLQEKQKQADIQKQNEINVKREQGFTELFTGKEKQNSIYGVQVGKADRDTFNMQFKGLLSPSEENPLVPWKVTKKVAEILSDDSKMYDLLYFAQFGDEKIRNTMSGIKHNAKRDLLDKTSIKPISNKGSDYVAGNINDPSNYLKPDPSDPRG